ncbi:hypothetical protein Fcan01_26604 [Folsomia candida]|uniref:Uncharacterized protein n=1 Tax=Folsomia candida TaxID=158441 RepID=A0A226CZE6_FOLCA|nr:hypothetical protein Fcan01_26604 [Folsomia candida]
MTQTLSLKTNKAEVNADQIGGGGGANFGDFSARHLNGAEIDEEVFPILVDQGTTPTIVFRLQEEQHVETNFPQNSSSCSQIYYINSPLASPSSPASSCSSFNQDVDYFKQALDAHVERHPEFKELIETCNSANLVDSVAATKFVNEFVSVLVSLKGNSPSTNDQKLFAKSIISLIPCWKYPGSPEGIDILYDDQSRSGLIQNRLRWIHRNVIAIKENKLLKRKANAGQTGQHANEGTSEAEEPPQLNQNIIDELNSTTIEADIIRLTEATFQHRAYLRKTNENSILKVYRKFTECDFLINLEFSLMHPGIEDNFLIQWPNLVKKLLDNRQRVNNKSQALKKFLREEFDKWDQSTLALFVLLYLIPPTARGKGQGGRCSIEKAKSRLVTFYYSGTPLQTVLDNWDPDVTQPTLIYFGDNKASPSSYFLICDRLTIPLSAKNSTQAIDSLRVTT